MKLKSGFIMHNVGSTQMMVATGAAGKIFHGLIRSNETAAFIVNCLKNETTEQEIVAAMLREYDAPEDVLARDVHSIVEKLTEIGALE